MPDILQTSDHYKHSRKWTLTGRWGEECIACLVFLLDESRTPVTKKKTLLGEINHLLRSSDELKVMLGDCDLSKSLSKILVSTLIQTLDEIGIESILLLEQIITCTAHPHSLSILEEVSRKFYENSNNHKVASLLGRTLSQLITENLQLRNEVIKNKLVDNMCDSLRPSREQIQNVILAFLLHLHSYSPLHQVLSELRLVKLVHNTIKLLASTTTVAKAVYLLNAVLSNESFATKHKTNLINQGKLMQGVKHALAYTKSNDVIATALSLLQLLDVPQLITQHNLLDYILECLSSEDESVCMSALDLCITSQHNNKSSVKYISDSLFSLVEREKKRMRGDIIERCLIFLLKLSEIAAPPEFPATVISVMAWANETLVGLLCLLLVKFKVKYCPTEAMRLLVELVKWLSINLSQRVRRLPTQIWLSSTTNQCKDGEQVLAVILNGMEYLISALLEKIKSLDETVLKDLVILVDEHCIPPVFSLETSELCPHVYKHLFSIMSRVLMSCCHVIGDKTVLNTSDSFANKFATKILGLSRDSFILRTTLCSSFKHPDVLSTLHSFTASTTCLFLSYIIPNTSPALHDTLIAGLEVLPYTELNAALTDCLRSAERPSYHSDLMGQSGFCGNVTCLALVLVKTCRSPPGTADGNKEHPDKVIPSAQSSETLSSILQIINLYGSHRLLPSFFLPLVVSLLSELRCTQVQGLKLCLDTQEQLGNAEYVTWNWKMLLFVLRLDGINEATSIKCAMLVVKKMREEKGDNSLDSTIGMKVLKILTDQGRIFDNISVVESLVQSCTDKKVLELIVSELCSAVMLDVSQYGDTLSVLSSISTVHAIASSTRTLVAVMQCVLCDSGNLTASLQYLYVQYVVNPGQLSDMFANRYDLIACICSQIKPSSPHLNVALLFLQRHLVAYPTTSGEMHVDIGNVVAIIQEVPSPLTLTLLWRLVQNDLLAEYSHGLSYLALSSIVDCDHSTSLSAASFVLSCSKTSLPWFNVLLQTSLLLDELPSGVMWLLANLDKARLKETTYQRINHLLKCLELQFHRTLNSAEDNSLPFEQLTVILKLLVQLFEIYPETVTKTISKCVLSDREESKSHWVRKGHLVYHKSSISSIRETKEAEIRKDYLKVQEYTSSCM